MAARSRNLHSLSAPARHNSRRALRRGRIRKPAYTQQLIAALLFDEGPRSRAELCERTGLPPPRLTEACAALHRSGLVVEAPDHRNVREGRGRPQTLLQANLTGLAMACVRHDVEHLRAAVIDLSGTVRWQRSWNVPPGLTPGRRIKRIVQAIKSTISAREAAEVRIIGCGIAEPGTVDLARGRAVRAVNVPGWRDVPILDAVRSACLLPAMLHRGDGWEALGEVAFGAGRQARHALYVTLVEGIGGGIVEHERLLAGRDGSAGEIGHTRVSDEGPLCGCGARGCLEAHLAPARLGALWLGNSKQARNNGSHNEDGRDDFSRMLDAARAGDSAAQCILADAAIFLARALGNAVSLLNPERIILGGRFVECGDLILTPLRESISRFTLDEFARGMDIRIAELSEPAFCGIAAEARRRLFAFPSIGAKLDRQDQEAA